MCIHITHSQRKIPRTDPCNHIHTIVCIMTIIKYFQLIILRHASGHKEIYKFLAVDDPCALYAYLIKV